MKNETELLGKHKHGETIVKRGSRKHDHDEHGSAWKVAFADFCLALMCLFLLMWVMAAHKQEQTEEALRTGGSMLNERGMFSEGSGRGIESMYSKAGSMIPREPLPPGNGAASETETGIDLKKRKYETPAEMRELAQSFKRLSEEAGLSGNLQTVVAPAGLRVMLHDTDKRGIFDRGSAVPSENFRRLLRKMGPVFTHIDNQLLIVGHTDSAQYSDRSHSAFSNWTLSTNRAMAARLYLLEGGMPQASLLQVVGMADRAPFDTEKPAAGMNRRIELVILTSEHAAAVSAMFGLTGDVRPLIEGVDLAIPGGNALSELRRHLLPAARDAAAAR